MVLVDFAMVIINGDDGNGVFALCKLVDKIFHCLSRGDVNHSNATNKINPQVVHHTEPK